LLYFYAFVLNHYQQVLLFKRPNKIFIEIEKGFEVTAVAAVILHRTAMRIKILHVDIHFIGTTLFTGKTS
jgi:hypothetical protein